MADYIKAAKVAGGMLFPNYGLTNLLAESVIKAVTKSNSVSKQGDINQLENEARIQEIENRISEFQARVAQELAIARRIENAAEVEIEEFYDTTGSGGVGLQTSEGSLNLGINGTGRKVTSRVYRFKGWVDIEDVITSEDTPDEEQTI